MNRNLQEVLILNGPLELQTFVLDVDIPTFDYVWCLFFKITYRLQPPCVFFGCWTAVEDKCVRYNPFKEVA